MLAVFGGGGRRSEAMRSVFLSVPCFLTPLIVTYVDDSYRIEGGESRILGRCRLLTYEKRLIYRNMNGNRESDERHKLRLRQSAINLAFRRHVVSGGKETERSCVKQGAKVTVFWMVRVRKGPALFKQSNCALLSPATIPRAPHVTYRHYPFENPVFTPSSSSPKKSVPFHSSLEYSDGFAERC